MTTIKKKPVLLLLLVLLGIAFFLATTFRGRNVSAMNCETHEQNKFDEIVAIEMLEGRAQTPVANEPTRVGHFLLKDFDAPIDGNDVILSIKSDQAGGIIYIGPFKEHIEVTMPERLFVGNDRDNFSIMVARKSKRQICSAEHAEHFWQTERKVTIKMLKSRELDKNGYPIAFAVSY